jgi:uncharacterized DUF497 family protein
MQARLRLAVTPVRLDLVAATRRHAGGADDRESSPWAVSLAVSFRTVYLTGKLTAEENLRKHGVAFEEGLTVFGDPLAQVFDDPDHSGDETRELIIGQSADLHLLIVSFTARQGRVRLIGARNVTPRERPDKTPRRTSKPDSHGMPAEYALDYTRAKPNRFASQMSRNVVAVVLEPASTEETADVGTFAPPQSRLGPKGASARLSATA